MKQIGGTIGIFHRNRYDDTAQQRATRQKTSSHQTKLNHMKRVFFSFISLFSWILEHFTCCVLCLSSPANSDWEFILSNVFTCFIEWYECFPPCNQFCFVDGIILATYSFMKREANTICAGIRERLYHPTEEAHTFCFTDCRQGRLNHLLEFRRCQ